MGLNYKRIFLYIFFLNYILFAYESKKALVLGDFQVPGGERRSDKSGGLYIGKIDNGIFRGVQLASQENSAWLFLREKSPLGQSLLFTIAPNPLTVNAESIKGTNKVKALINKFNKKYEKGAIVNFALKKYKIKKVINNTLLSLCLLKPNGKCVEFKFSSKIRDNLVVPAFYFEFKGSIINNILIRNSGDYLPPFSPYEFIHKQISIKVNGQWYTLCGKTKKGFKVCKKIKKNIKDTFILMRYQPDYTLRLDLKRTSGQGLEEGLGISSMYDCWQYDSTGSNVAVNKPHIFSIQNKKILLIKENKIEGRKKIIAPKFTIKNSSSEIEISSGKNSPINRLNLPRGSLYIRNDKNNVHLYLKTGSTIQDWIIIK